MVLGALVPRVAQATEVPGDVETLGTVTGTVTEKGSGALVHDAIVVLQCSCLSGFRDTKTDPAGRFSFRELPPGRYTVQVLYGQANVSKVIDMKGAKTMRVSFSIEPRDKFRKEVRVSAAAVESGRGSIALAGGTTSSSDFVDEFIEAPPRRRTPRPAQRRVATAAVIDPALPAPDLPAVEGRAATEADTANLAHQVVYSGSMALTVLDLDTARESAETLVKAAGGYVQRMGDDGMTLRIPAPRFREIMDRIGTLGQVDARAMESEDVTEEYTDLTTRIAVLQRTHAQLMELLGRAKTVDDALQVQNALNGVTLDLERALGRKRALDARIDYSVLALAFSTRTPQTKTPSSNDPFPWVDEIGVEVTEWR